MNSQMRNSILYAFRRGDSTKEIAKALGFPEETIKKVVCPSSTCKITTSVVSVRKPEKGAHVVKIREEIRVDDRIERAEGLLIEALKLLRDEKNHNKTGEPIQKAHLN